MSYWPVHNGRFKVIVTEEFCDREKLLLSTPTFTTVVMEYYSNADTMILLINIDISAVPCSLENEK